MKSRTNQVPAQYRQGDVLLERIEKLPAGAKKEKLIGGRIVLAQGANAGRAHVIDSKGAQSFVDAKGQRYVEITGRSARLEHAVGGTPDHATIALPQGIYRNVRQRNMRGEDIQNVID